MNRNSYLNGNTLSAECTQKIRLLETEIQSLQNKSVVCKNFPDDGFHGDSADALKHKLQHFNDDYLTKLIDCDQLNIERFKKFISLVSGVVIDGMEVLDGQSEAYRNAQDCGRLASDYFQKAYLATSKADIEHFRSLAEQQDKMANQWNQIYRYWLNQESLFNAIDAKSASIFSPHVTPNRGSLISGVITGTANNILQQNATPVLPTDPDYILLNQWNYSDEQIQFILKNKPGYVSILRNAMTSNDPKYSQNVINDINNYLWSNSLYIPSHNPDDYDVNNSNCLSFAWGIVTNPINNKEEALLPGSLSGQAPRYEDYLDYNAYLDAKAEYYNNNLKNTDDALRIFREDAAAVGINLTPIAPGSQGGQGGFRVALYKRDNPLDYHWCVYNEETNTWEHKNGTSGIVSTKFIGSSYSNEPLGTNPLVHPTQPATSYSFVQEFYITPKC